ncbi:hypothetical protein AU476_31070 [Cupriavidus sp. UYMSc13B]|nr:hypothetical protein AU476_31070 [Cupriavidus sp. UYMSc13B]
MAVTAGAGRRAFAGYFEQEVLAQLAPEDLDMLTRTAICHRLCAPLCAAMAGHAPAAAHTARRLAQLEQDNLFITRIGANERDSWYRLHPMLREVLLARWKPGRRRRGRRCMRPRARGSAPTA